MLVLPALSLSFPPSPSLSSLHLFLQICVGDLVVVKDREEEMKQKSKKCSKCNLQKIRRQKRLFSHFSTCAPPTEIVFQFHLDVLFKQ